MTTLVRSAGDPRAPGRGPARVLRRCAHASGRAVALLLVLLLAAVAAAQEPAPVPAPAATSSSAAARHGVAVLPPRVDPSFASVREGLREWLAERLDAAGVGVLPRQRVQAALGGAEDLTSADLPPVARKIGAAMVLMSELRFRDGEVDLRLRLHDGGDGRVVTGAGGTGRVAELGEVARTTLVSVLGQLEFQTGALENAPPPRLSDWSALARARRELERDDLVAAWRSLSHVHGSTADRLRAEIEARGEGPDVSPVLRSRLANASGRPDRDWLRVRNALRKGEDAETLLAAGDAAAARAEPEAAIRFYTRASEVDPSSLQAQLGRGALLLEAGRDEEAAEAYRAAAELAPDDPRPHAGLARVGALAGPDRARHMMRAGELHASRLEVEAARESFEEAGALDGNLVATAYRNVARLNERIGNHGEALLGYEQSFELGAQDPELLLALGRTRAHTGDVRGAEEAFRDALERDGQLADAHRGLGEALGAEGRSEDALPHLEQAVALAPGDVRARRALGKALHTAGRGDAALEALDPDALPADTPAWERADLMREAAGLHQEQGQLDEAEVLLQAAVQLEPDDPPLRTALASVYDAKGLGERAEAERAVVASLTGLEIVPTAMSEGTSPVTSDDGAPVVRSFAALVESFPPHDPKTGLPLQRVFLMGVEERTDLEGRLRRLLFPRRPDVGAIESDLRAAIAARFPIQDAPPVPEELETAVDRLRDFTTDSETVATVNAMLRADAVFFARLSTAPLPGENLLSPERLKLEVRIFEGATSKNVTILANTLALGAGAASYAAWNWVAIGPWLLILGLLAYPFVRGWGAVVVKLEYDTKAAKGFFNIRLSRRPGKAGVQKSKQSSSRTRQYQQKVRSWSRLARNMVDPVTTFRLVPARSWYVSVYGLLQDPKTQEVIGNYLEERQVQVGRGETATLEFDFRAKEAPIEVRLTRSQGEGQGVATDVRAVVALRGRPDTLRYLRDGSALLHVPNGSHVVLLGCEDRVLEQRVLIQDFVGASVSFPIDVDEMAVFTGCSEAVEPYLAGDLPATSQALDRAGQTELANLLRAEYHKERGESAEAARYYQAAGRVHEAAELSAQSADVQGSATLFEKAGDFGKAGDQYRQVGDLERAAASYESAYDYDSAIECYRQAGRHDKVLELCEKTGANFDAAQAALDLGDEDRAIRNLQQVDLRDPSYLDSCRLLSDLFASRGDVDMAVDRLGDAVSAAGEDTVALDLLEKFGALLERAGHLERALEVFERIRKRDYAYPGAADRIAVLRENLQVQRATETFSTGAATVAAGVAGGAPSAPSRYELEGELGRGGMGVVYKARDTRLGRIVALKRLPENLRENQTAVELFLREARSAAALNHPNIVTLYDADQDGDNYYLTMEFLDGLPLDAILKKRGKLSARDVGRLGGQVCTGLQYAHERKIVHRDIKTSNLFFTRDRVIKIMDFGLAKMMEEVRRSATVIGGTPYYMAPEQAIGQGVDHRADIYALGVTFFELVTGDVPFKEGDVTYHHRHTPSPDPRERDPDVPAPLAELILQMMSKDKEQRPASASEVGTRLAAMVAELPAG